MNTFCMLIKLGIISICRIGMYLGQGRLKFSCLINLSLYVIIKNPSQSPIYTSISLMIR